MKMCGSTILETPVQSDNSLSLIVGQLLNNQVILLSYGQEGTV